MKRLLLGSLVVVLGMSLASNVRAYTGSYTPDTGINGTVHDLSRAVNGMNYVAIPADAKTRICIFCHAPHNPYKLSPANGGPGAAVGGGTQAPDAFTYLPLWNHELTGNFASYTMYQNGPGAPQNALSPKTSQAIANGMTPGSVSLLCLSCHDGSVAVNSYGTPSQLSSSQSSGGGTIGAQYIIGKDNYLGNHHPIGFDYDAVQSVDTEIRPADTTNLTATSTIRDHLFGPGSSMLECATCHSVHNKGNPNGETLLWRSDVDSQLCLTCHDKGVYTAP